MYVDVENILARLGTKFGRLGFQTSQNAFRSDLFLSESVQNGPFWAQNGPDSRVGTRTVPNSPSRVVQLW